MRKPLDLSKFSDATITTSTQPHSFEVKAFISWVELLISKPQYEFAEESLMGILGTVKERGVVTDAQREAVENICAGGERKDRREDEDRPRRGGSRRYEGWSR